VNMSCSLTKAAAMTLRLIKNGGQNDRRTDRQTEHAVAYCVVGLPLYNHANSYRFKGHLRHPDISVVVQIQQLNLLKHH